MSWYIAILLGIISGAIVAIATRLINYRKNIPPQIKVAEKISHYDKKYRIKLLNETDYPISIISSSFVLSYRKDSKKIKEENYRYLLSIPGDSIPFIHPQKKDTISQIVNGKKNKQNNEQTYATLVINAQRIDKRTIAAKEVSQAIQKKYLKYKEYEDNKVSESYKDLPIPESLSIDDFFEEDDNAYLIAIITVKNLINNVIKTEFHYYNMDEIGLYPYQRGRKLELAIPEQEG